MKPRPTGGAFFVEAGTVGTYNRCQMPTIHVPRETAPGERRVAVTPETVRKLVKGGTRVSVESSAGTAAHISDAQFSEAGAELAGADAVAQADVIVSVAPPPAARVHQLRSSAIHISFLYPARNEALVAQLEARGIRALAMDRIPRVTRAQGMDALSSQASIAGYKAVLLAASRLGRYFPLLMTAAGTIPPAKVVIMGAGVAGLQAIATAKRMGAVVEVSDIRPAVREQVQSLGGRFIELPMEESGEGSGGYAKAMGEDFLRKQREIITRHVAAADVVITTAQVPGAKAPVLISREMVEAMRPGAVIVDLAVDAGGNCELSQPEAEVEHQGVLILGYSNLPATMAEDASSLYARNVLALLLHMKKDDAFVIDPEDEITGPALVTGGTRESA